MILDWRQHENEPDVIALLASSEFTRRAIGAYTPRDIFCRGQLWTLDELVNHLGLRKEFDDAERQRQERAEREAAGLRKDYRLRTGHHRPRDAARP